VEPTEEGTKKMTTRRSLVGILGGDMRMRGTRRLVATVEGSMARRKMTRRRNMVMMRQGGGIGDYLKLAQGFMNKKDGGE